MSNKNKQLHRSAAAVMATVMTASAISSPAVMAANSKSIDISSEDKSIVVLASKDYKNTISNAYSVGDDIELPGNGLGQHYTSASFNVKKGAYANTVIELMKKAISTDAASTTGKPVTEVTGGSELSGLGGPIESSGTATFTVNYGNDGGSDSVNVTYTVVEPDGYRFKTTLPNITATSEHNDSASKLLSYINSDLSVEAYGSVYDVALGDGETGEIPSFDWDDCNTDFNENGGLTYIFTQEYKGKTLTREVSVAGEATRYDQEFSCQVKENASGESVRVAISELLVADVEAVTHQEVTDTVMTGSLGSLITRDGAVAFEVTYADGCTENITVRYTVVEPTGYAFKNELEDIPGDSEYNNSADALLSYVNSDLAVIGTGTNYNAAIGDVTMSATKLSWSNCDKQYDAKGGLTYTFTKAHDGYEFSRSVTVGLRVGEGEVDRYQQDYNCDVKAGTNGSWLKTKLYDVLKTNIQEVTGFNVSRVLLTSQLPSTIPGDGRATFLVTYEDKSTETVMVNYTSVMPESYSFKNTLKDINADSPYNASMSKLVDYVNSDLELSTIGDRFNNALGEPVVNAPKFTSSHCSDTFDAKGGVTYTFIQEYNGTTLIREFTVNTVSKSTPNVSIDYNDNTLNGVDAEMSWSTDKSKWSKCTPDMAITDAMLGKTVYFCYLETQSHDQSAIDELYIPEKAEVPSAKMETTAGSKTITITNCDDYDDCEFSINGTTWVETNDDTYTFKNLKPGTSYKVYVRAEANPGHNLASSAKYYSVTTLKTEDVGVEVTTEKKNNTGYVYGNLEVESEISNKILTASISSDLIKNFCDQVEDFIDSYRTVYSELTIEQDDNGSYNGVKLTMPLSSLKDTIEDSNFTIKYKSDILDVTIDGDDLTSTSSTMRLEFSEPTSAPTSSKLSWVKTQYNNDRPVYRVNTEIGSKDLTVTYTIPYELGKNETISELNVYEVDLNGNKSKIDTQYNVYSGQFEFESNIDGYIVIADDGYSDYMPFIDVKPNYWAYNYIKTCYNRGWMNGVDTNRFSSESNITRGMIFTILARMSGESDIKVDKSKFTDVALTDWYSDAAHWALENKLISGSKFDANSAMTRAEIAEVLYNYLVMLDYSGDTDYKDLRYTDVDKLNTDTLKAIAFLDNRAIMMGTSSTKFSPNTNVTRAQMATIICRLDNLIN